MTTRRSKKRRLDERENLNRLNVVLAVIFLLVFLILVKMYSLQILQYDKYSTMAAGQHDVFSKLKPDRGRVFIQGGSLQEAKLYPVATNKEFSLVYAIPDLIKKPNEVAEVLYDILDSEDVLLEVEELLDDEEYYSEQEKAILEFSNDEQKEDFKDIKRILEIGSRKKEKVDYYYKRLSKKNDPYEPLKRKVDKDAWEKLADLDISGIKHSLEMFRFYPEKNIGSQFLGFVGFSSEGAVGQYGLEGFFNEELGGKYGSLKTERNAFGAPVIINEREYQAAEDGDDLILSINQSIQFYVCQELKKAVERHEAEGGTVIVMNPSTGAILAMCSVPDYDSNNYNQVENIELYNNPAIFNTYEPGSIFKVFTMAAGIDQGKVSPDTLFQDKGSVMIDGWDKPIKNSDFSTKGAHGLVDMNYVLEQSLNTGTIFVMEETGDKVFADYVQRFGFGEKTGIELETEGLSNIQSLERRVIRPVEAATASFGQGITVTPLQMITAYSAIANGGILMKPYMVSEIISFNGERHVTIPKEIRRVVSERTAMFVSGMMVNVVDGGHAKLAGVDGYYLGGKTGTAQVANKNIRGYSDATIHSFVGFGPADDPKFVTLVKLDDPKDVDYSASSAAPLFGKIADFILKYYQIPKDR